MKIYAVKLLLVHVCQSTQVEDLGFMCLIVVALCYIYISSDAELKIKAWQVLELEGAKTTLSQENMQMLDNLSTLQSRVQDLEKSLLTVVSPADVQNVCLKRLFFFF